MRGIARYALIALASACSCHGKPQPQLPGPPAGTSSPSARVASRRLTAASGAAL